MFQVLLPLVAPASTSRPLYGLLFLDPLHLAVFWLGFTALQGSPAAYALRTDREPLRDLWVVPLQQFVYRQLMYLVMVQSVVTALLGTRQRWQVIRRSGVFASRANDGRTGVARGQRRMCRSLTAPWWHGYWIITTQTPAPACGSR